MTKLPDVEICPKQKIEDFPGPAPHFDAVEYAKNWTGRGWWGMLLRHLAEAGECTVCYTNWMETLGLVGFPAEAVYDLIHGQGAFARNSTEHEARHKKAAFEEGFAFAKATEPGKIALAYYEGPFPEEYKRGLEEGLALASARLN